MMNIFIGFEDKIEDCKNFLFNYKKKVVSSKFLSFFRLKNFNLHFTLAKRKIEDNFKEFKNFQRNNSWKNIHEKYLKKILVSCQNGRIDYESMREKIFPKRKEIK